jgi:pyridinium-3,5-biscarboxylic acid mononucleotide sulfurtransferase
VEKLVRIKQAILEKGRLIVLLSGGLDSTLLAKIAHDVLGEDSCALTFDSPIIPQGDLDEAKALADLIGIRHVVIEMDELSEPDFIPNPVDRCYLCRKLRDAKALIWAHAHGFSTIADGLNASDLSDYRPGMKAAREDGVWQPFAEQGITKDQIRDMARELGLSVWDKPTTVCLCSRFPYGIALKEGLLRRVEAAEGFLKNLGFKQVRVRHFPFDTALVEVDDLSKALQHRDEIIRSLRQLGFTFVSLDLEGFASGKLNRMLDK